MLEDIQLAVLNQSLNLTPRKLGVILKLYSNIANAIQDDFRLLLTQEKFAAPDNLYAQQRLMTETGFEQIDLSKNHAKKSWFEKLINFNKAEFEQTCLDLEEKLIQNNIQILDQDNFPPEWKRLTDKPIQLFYQGNPERLQDSFKLTVVGSRNCLKYTQIIMDQILNRLKDYNITVVSGLALGVDTLAHQINLKSGGKCIGVIGSGMDKDNFYPSQNWNLKNEIIQNQGLVLSEYPPGFRATNFSFPMRNRFLASLSPITWVAQAGIKSGSLITARLALDFGQTLAVTPASILESGYEGNLKLLKEGCNIISQLEDILDLFGLKQIKSNFGNIAELSFEKPEQAMIYRNLSFNPVSVQDLCVSTRIPIPRLNTELSMMELYGHIQNVGENMWIRGGT